MLKKKWLKSYKLNYKLLNDGIIHHYVIESNSSFMFMFKHKRSEYNFVMV